MTLKYEVIKTMNNVFTGKTFLEVVFSGTKDECEMYASSARKRSVGSGSTFTVKVAGSITAKTTKSKEKDYTLNGTISATTWQEFRIAMKEVGIYTGTKKYEELVTEYNLLLKAQEAEAEKAKQAEANKKQNAGVKQTQKNAGVKQTQKNAGAKQATEQTMTMTTFMPVKSSNGYTVMPEVKEPVKPIAEEKAEVITSLPEGYVNMIVGYMFEMKNRSYFKDSQLTISTRNIFKAITKASAEYLSVGTIKGIINFLVKTGYLKFEKHENGIQFILNYSDVVRDADGKVIGVRNAVTPKVTADGCYTVM